MEVLKRTLEEMKIQSSALQSDIETVVYLPPHYSPLYTYPLIIAQDGQDYFNLGRIASLAEQLISEGQMRSTIIVGVPYENKKQRWHRYHPDGEEHESYLRFLTRELLPSIAKNYAVDDLASERYLVGDSLGGTLSLDAVLRYPHTFGNAIMQSPFISEKMIERVKAFQHAPQINLYHSIGTEETAVETTWGKHADFYKPNQQLHEIISQKSFASYHYAENDGNHTWTYWQDDLKNALLAMLSAK